MIGSLAVRRLLLAIVACALATTARAQPVGPTESLDLKIAVWRFDALGIEPELVARSRRCFGWSWIGWTSSRFPIGATSSAR